MKLGPRDIESYLRDPGRTCCALIYGVDGGLVRQRVTQLVTAWLGPKADPMARLELTGDEISADPAKLADELAAMSLMSERRAILVREVEDKHLPAVEQALSLRAPHNFLILYATDSLAGSKLRSWAERAENAASLPCYKDEGSGLDQLLRDTLKGYGLRVSSDALRYLATQLGGDRQVILNELEKLSLYMGDEAEEVTLDDVMAAVGENNDKSLDDLAFAVAGGDIPALCRLSDRLQVEGNVGVVLVRALVRYFARLEQLALARAAGQSLDVAIESLRPPVFFKTKPLLKSHAQRWNAGHCADAIARLQILELDSKRYADQSLSRMAQGFLQIAELPGPARRAA